MTLITRLIREEDTFLAGDKATTDSQGNIINKKREKLIVSKNPIGAIGVAGILDFRHKQKRHLVKNIIESWITSDIKLDDLSSKLRDMFLQNCPDKIKEASMIILLSAVDEGIFHHKVLVKNKNNCRFNFGIERRRPSELLDSNAAKILCYNLSINYEDAINSFNGDELFNVIDFNLTYSSMLGGSNKVYPKLIYTLLHLFFYKSPYKFDDIAWLNDYEVNQFLYNFYKFIMYQSDALIDNLPQNEYGKLRIIASIREIESLVKINKEEAIRLM